MNPFISNCRTGCHDDILNRTSHYCKLLNTRSTIDNRHEKTYHSLLNKNDKNIQTKRLNSNLKLMNSIFDIQRHVSRYIPESDGNQDRKKSLKNGYRERQKELAISQGNVRLYKKILGVQSDNSQQKLIKFSKEVDKFAKLKINPMRHITEMDSEFFNTYRKQLFKGKVTFQKFNQLVKKQSSNNKIINLKPQKRRRNKKLTKIGKIQRESLPKEQLDNPEAAKSD